MNHMFHGYDMDRTMLRIGAMNMMTHGVSNPNIEYRDSLSDQNEDKEKSESLQNQKDRTPFPDTVCKNVENRRKMCLHCTGWRTFRFVQST